jgi:hypothetical protein
MQRNLYFPFILLALSLLFITCSEESDPQFEADNFVRVYDNNQFNMRYSPLDVEQTADGGYLILASMRTDTSGASFPGVYLLKTDKYGKFVKELEVDPAFTDYVSATSDLILIGEQYYFVCMNITTQAKLVAVSPDGDITATTDLGLTYPMAAALDGNNIVVLSYDHDNKKTVISSVSPGGEVIRSAQYDVGAGGEDVIDSYIVESFLVDGRKFPYFVGRIPGSSYYFNGFVTYTFSLVFTSGGSGDDGGGNISGSIAGQQDDGGMSALVPLGAGKFAASRFMFKENYLLPRLAMETSGSAQATDLAGLSFPEMVPNSTVKILRATINDKAVIIYGVNTKSGQIGLLFYDEATGAFISSRYLGFSNPYEIGSLLQTEDGGIAVSGTTYVAGRFARVCLFKFSKDELAENVNQ